MTDEKTDILLARYFSGEATEQELKQLDTWLAESEEHEKLFYEMTALYQQTGPSVNIPADHTEKAFQQFASYIHLPEQKTSRKRPFYIPVMYASIAASVLFLIGFFLYRFLQTDSGELVADGGMIRKTLFRHIEVTLSPNSVIRYSSGDRDEVVLKGEATFVVNPGKEKEFLVMAGETFIRDIGTAFTVSSSSNDMVTVSVNEGEILFYTLDDPGVHVKKGEQACYDPSGKRFFFLAGKESDPVSADPEPSGADPLPEALEEKIGEESSSSEVSSKEIRFEAAYLSEVVHELNFLFGADIIIQDPSLRTMQISVTFNRNESLDTILSVIAETLSVKIVKNGNKYIISE